MLAQSQLRPTARGSPLIRLRFDLRLPLAASLVCVLLAAVPVSAHPRAQFPVQSVGDRGTDVTAVQHLLRARGHSTPVTGLFSTVTREAVQSFQAGAGLNQSGVVNVATWQKLVPNLAPGASGEAVLALKKQLNSKRRAGLSLNQSYDAATRNAVAAFQRHMRLTETGRVDVTTWRNLVWHFERPAYGNGSLCNYNGGNASADWGTANAVASLEAAARLFNNRTGLRVAVGDISFEHGGDIRLHGTHEDGLDIDIALIRTDGRQCNNPGISYRSSRYDRADTRALLVAIHEAFGNHLQLVYFNDPQMIRSGLSIKFPNHDDHIHVRVCEVSHPKSRYVC